MSTYSEEMLHLDSDIEGEGFTSDDDIGSDRGEEMLHLDSDIEGEEFTSGDGVGTNRDELGKENSNGKKCSSEITDDDIRAMEFSTEQEAIDFYTAYAHSQGFAIRKDDVKRNHEKQRCCTHCRMPDHTIQRCPVLARIDVDEEVGEEEKREDEDSISENEANRLNVSIRHKMNDKKLSVPTTNGRHGFDNIIGTKRKREADKAGFSTQDTRKTGAPVTPNIKINIENNGVPHAFGYDVNRTIKHESQSTGCNHGVGYAGNYFPMYSGISNFGGSIFPQFPPTAPPITF